MFHMGWFMGKGFGVQGWGSQWAGDIADEWMNPELYIEMAQSLERAGFDYMMFEDSLMVTDTYRGTMEHTLANAEGAPKNDPFPLLPLLAYFTKHIGLIATMATPFYPPFTAARLATTLDHLTKGRVGLNLVTASSHRSAQNYGLEKHIEHDKRYDMAHEWMQVVDALWASWEPGAIVADTERKIYADHTKVHAIDFEGTYYKSRGPLNTQPGPQRRPVICQAGGSPAGKAFGARYADTIIAATRGHEEMKVYRADISRRMIDAGRKPSDCKVLYLVNPILADTDAEAEEQDRLGKLADHHNLEGHLGRLSYFSGIDMAQFDPDQPLPDDIESRVNGHQSAFGDYLRTGKTLRDMAAHRTSRTVDLVGSADTVAAKMGELMEGGEAGDGFLIASAITRKSIAEVADGLAPALKRRGLVRPSYDGKTFKENLLAF
jgi:FMN-dependent oxidoreductase (nitrilotriacetate monooxygenase family)